MGKQQFLYNIHRLLGPRGTFCVYSEKVVKHINGEVHKGNSNATLQAVAIWQPQPSSRCTGRISSPEIGRI